MQKSLYVKDSTLINLMIFFFSAGLIFHLIGITRPFVLVITDLTMLAANAAVFYSFFRKDGSRRLATWSIITFLLTFLIELIGVKTGLIFGSYQYGDVMFLQIAQVPVVIGMNWVILILGSYSLSLSAGSGRYFAPLISSIIIVIFDFVMEEVAMQLGYWHWDGNAVPFQNYIAWFIISLIFTSLLTLYKVSIKNNVLNVYFMIQFLFFLTLRVFLS